MGITLKKIDDIRRTGLLPKGASVLDIGSSNLYSASEQDIRAFLWHYDAVAENVCIGRLSAGSAYGPNGIANAAFVGELIEMAGMRYLSLDIANGHRTLIFDLNSQSLSRKHVGAFDLVLNFGTTEHVINQLNSFRVIHDATMPGGHIVHELPSVGFIDHGYFCYTPRFLFDLAAYNEYEVVDFAYQGPAPGNPINDIVRDYATFFPALEHSLPAEGVEPLNVASHVIYRKVKDTPFRLPLETSTSVTVEAALRRNGGHDVWRLLRYRPWAGAS